MLQWVLVAVLAATVGCSNQGAGGTLKPDEHRREIGPLGGTASRAAGFAQPLASLAPAAPPLSPEPQPEPSGDLARADCRSSNAPRHYFPPRAFFASSNGTSLDEVMTSRYSRALLLARAGSLSCAPPTTDEYRLLIFRSGPFTETPIDVVHVKLDADRSSVSRTSVRGDRNLDAASMGSTARRQLAPAEVSRLLSQLQRSSFWTMPRNEDLQLGCSVTSWVLEGRSRDQYRVVQGLSPLVGEFRTLCSVIAALGGLDCR